jgi:argininosuccinate lyase
MMMEKIWGGRFAEDADPGVMAFTGSFGFDVRLLPFDLRGSLAHARMLAAVGLLTPEEGRQLIAALDEILRETSETPPDGEAEDVHSWVENRLRQKVGALAGKLHTARSRNDQVALDVRLYLLNAVDRVLAAIEALLATLVARAEENLDAIMPGYTHLQPAQPVLLAHHLMAYFEMLRRDHGRFADARRRAMECPLGSGALAGTSLPIDREMTARELGFARPTRNSMDSVSERDFPLEFSSAAAVAMVHLSRMGEELVLWSSPAYGFIRLPDRLATGSSMMPQKKNPDVAELVRGKSGRVFGHLMSLLVMMKGLPLAYQRDLQEDKEALFDTVDTLTAALRAVDLYWAGIGFNKDRMAAEARREHAVATDLAEYLVTRGLPFREAHEVVGAIVRDAVTRGKELDELSLSDLHAHHELIGEEVLEFMTPAGSARHKQSPGSTSPCRVAEAIREAKEFLSTQGGNR